MSDLGSPTGTLRHGDVMLDLPAANSSVLKLSNAELINLALFAAIYD